MKTMQKVLSRLMFVLACGGILAQVDSASGEIAGPGVLTHTTFNAIPFAAAADPTHYQQAYDYTYFDGITGPQFLIEALSLSPQPPGGTYSANIVIRLATTSLAASSLNSILADDDASLLSPFQTVFEDASFSQSMGTGGVSGTNFTLHFDFAPEDFFLYTPSAGTNLLMDIQISAQSNNAMSIGSNAICGSAYQGRFNGSRDGGVRTQFTGTSVPEPSTLVLLGMGGVGLIALARTRRRKRA